MKFLSLFTGIGGIDLGLERAGMKCVAQVEIDPFCRAVLAKHWPDVPRFNDVRKFNRSCIDENVDLIAGGFPCQDVSTAGSMRGLENGSRSGLYREVLRLACEFRPRYLFMENVAGLFVDGRIGIVLGDLATIGFDAEWDCIPAAAIGAHHIRDRVFILAYSERLRWSAHLRGREPGILGGASYPTSCERAAQTTQASGGREGFPIWSDSEMSGANDPADLPSRPERPALVEQWLDEPDLGRVVDGIPAWLDRYRTLGNSVHPDVATWIGQRIMLYERGTA
jgi:DNA (cytosine-5)-methyltransferase 1